MPDPLWAGSPPEVNYLRLTGDGAAGTATTLANAAAWQALVGSSELAATLSTLNTAVTSLDFTGIGGLSSTTAIAGLNTALQMLCTWAQEKSSIAASAVAAYQTAVSTMIPAEVSVANRAEQAAAVALNPLVLGALTPAIVALDAAYFGEHWPHNASAGTAYGAALTGLVAALTVPPPLPPQGASLASPASVAAGTGERVGQAIAEEDLNQTGPPVPTAAAIGQMGSKVGQSVQAALGSMPAATGMFHTPLQAASGMAGLLPTAWRGAAVEPAVDAAGDGEWEPLDQEVDLLEPDVLGLGLESDCGEIGLVEAVGPGAPSAGLPAAGLTSYTRPRTGFDAVSPARSMGSSTGLLSATPELQGMSTSGGMPVSPSHVGTNNRELAQKKDVSHAQVVLERAGASTGVK